MSKAKKINSKAGADCCASACSAWSDARALEVFRRVTNDETDWRSEDEKAAIAQQVRDIKNAASAEDGAEIVAMWKFDDFWCKSIASHIRRFK